MRFFPPFSKDVNREEWCCLDSTSDRQKSGNDLDNWYFAMWNMD